MFIELFSDDGGQYMSKADLVDNNSFVYGSIFLLGNKIQTMMDRELQIFDVTSRQWFLSIALVTFFEEPPTLKELAKMMGTSHQNVKTIAEKLALKGLVKISKDKKDKRALRISLTAKSIEFWAQLDEPGKHFMGKLFQDVSEEEMLVVRKVMNLMANNLECMEQEKINEKAAMDEENDSV